LTALLGSHSHAHKIISRRQPKLTKPAFNRPMMKSKPLSRFAQELS